MSKKKPGGSIDLTNAEDVVISNSDIAGDVRFQDGKRLVMNRNRHGDAARANDAALSRAREQSIAAERRNHRWAVIGAIVGIVGVVVAVIFGILQLRNG